MKRKEILLFIALGLTNLTCQKAGSGGKAILSIHVFYGGTYVKNANVYIKYGADTDPGANASYDTFQEVDDRGQTDFKGLKKGDYWLRAEGYERIDSNFVSGGTYVQIATNGGELSATIRTELDQ